MGSHWDFPYPDARRVCGYDVRQSGIGPIDESRLEAFLARYGGTLSCAFVGNAAMALQWVTASGQVITTTGLTTGVALEHLTRVVQTHSE